MCFYDLHISSNAQLSILMRNHKKLTEVLVEIKKIQNGFIIHNKCRNFKHTTQLKQKKWRYKYQANGL